MARRTLDRWKERNLINKASQKPKQVPRAWAFFMNPMIYILGMAKITKNVLINPTLRMGVEVDNRSVYFYAKSFACLNHYIKNIRKYKLEYNIFEITEI